MSNKIYLFSISSHPDAISVNSLDIKLLEPKIDFSQYDYLIITSKQATKALQSYNTDTFINKPALCISKQSALSYENIGGNVLEVGSGYGDTLTDVIQAYPKETKWLYLRAQEIASSFVEICKNNGYDIDEEIVYKSFCSEDILNVNVETNATLIFTSPSSIKCFLSNKTISSSNKVIVIGKTTAASLPSDIEYKIAKENTIVSCMELI